MSTNEGLPFSLFDLETAINRRKYDLASKYLTSMLEFFENAEFIERRYVEPENKDNNQVFTRGFYPFTSRLSPLQKTEYFNRLAACLTTLLTDPDYRITQDIFIYLLLFKCHLTAIFGASSFFNMDHILIQRGLCTTERKLNLKTEDDIKMAMAFYSLNSEISIDPAMFLAADKLMGTYFYIALLYQCTTVKNATAEKNLFNLINNYKVVDEFQPDATMIQMIVNPWMDITYIDNPNKHKLKEKLNDYILRCEPLILDKKTKKRIKNTQSKPKKKNHILIIIERYRATHAMYRCYDHQIKRLAKHFDVTLITEKGQIDDINKTGLDSYHEVDKSLGEIDSIINLVLDIKPSVIWYPSLGMSTWAPIIANYRLAPTQIMSLGHPASSFTKTIDYLLPLGIPPQDSGYQQYCSEKVVDMNRLEITITRPSNFPDQLPKKKIHDNVVRVMVNSSEFKITNYFLSFCQLIDRLTTSTIEFHFFGYKTKGAYPYMFEREIRSKLCNIVYHPHLHYPAYLQLLVEGDVALGTYPFGGSNTNADLALLGIPKLIMARDGDFNEIADRHFYDGVGMPKELYTYSEDEYIQQAVKLIDDPEFRHSISEKLRRIEPDKHEKTHHDHEQEVIDFFKQLLAKYH